MVPKFAIITTSQITSHEIINLAVGDVGILLLRSYSEDFNLPTQHFKIFGRFYFIEFLDSSVYFKKNKILVIINTIITTPIKTSNYLWAKKIQEKIAKNIITNDGVNREMEFVCGIDVCYRNNVAYCSAVIMNKSFKIIEIANTKSSVKYPYIPSLFMLRESGPILNTLRTLHNSFAR